MTIADLAARVTWSGAAGVAAMTAAHPDVHIYSPALDASLNAKKFIVPGLGDAGDRIFGTK